MAVKKKNTALKAAFMYIILMSGAWMFVDSCGSSYKRLAGEDIVPASFEFGKENAEISILGHKASIDTSAVRCDSKLYSGMYILSPDELRVIIYLISLTDKL